MVLEDFILHFTRCAETRRTAVGDHVVGTEHLDRAVDDLLPDSALERLRACNLVGRGAVTSSDLDRIGLSTSSGSKNWPPLLGPYFGAGSRNI